ncbi:MAG: rod shape-determining protein MreD [Planctomycetaceae bacterium]
MMAQLGALVLVYCAYVVEATGITADPRGVEPRWLLLAAALVMWTQRVAPAVLWGGLCGLLMDSVSGAPLGLGLAIVSLAVWCSSWLRRDRRWSSGMALLIATFALTALSVVVTAWLSLLLTESRTPDMRRLLLLAGGQGAMTALWGGGLWLVFRMLATSFRKIVPPLDWRQTRG